MKSSSNQPFKGLNNLHHHIFFFLFLLPSICSKVYTKWTQQLQSSKLNRSLWEHCTLLAACCFTTVQQLRLMSVCCLCRVCVYLKYLYLCTRATEMEILALFLFHMCLCCSRRSDNFSLLHFHNVHFILCQLDKKNQATSSQIIAGLYRVSLWRQALT